MMPQVHVNVTFETIEEAAAFFGKAKAKGSTTAQTTQASPPSPSIAAQAAVPSVIPATSTSRASTTAAATSASPSDLAAAQDRARQAYQNYVGRGQGRTAETGKVFMTELGINAGIRNCSDPVVLHALADKFDAS
jgi:hypothetical protein